MSEQFAVLLNILTFMPVSSSMCNKLTDFPAITLRNFIWQFFLGPAEGIIQAILVLPE